MKSTPATGAVTLFETAVVKVVVSKSSKPDPIFTSHGSPVAPADAVVARTS
jgi:hypothetical protein